MTAEQAEQQRTEALALANHIRSHIANYKRALYGRPYHEGLLQAAELLKEPVTGPLAAMKVGHLLESIRKVGDTKAAQMLYRAGIYSRERRLGMLTARQRTALSCDLDYRAQHYEHTRRTAA